MIADLRGFEYPFEPLLRQRRWQLEALQARLGRLLRELEEAHGALEQMRSRYRSQHELAAKVLAERPDPSHHPRLMGWLVRLRESIASADRAIEDLRAERAKVAAECLAQQQRVEVLERHRADCVAEFRRAEERRLATEADREWLSRREWSGGGRADTAAPALEARR